MDRRTSIKWMMAAAAAMQSLQLRAGETSARDVSASQAGYGTDPNEPRPVVRPPAPRETVGDLTA